MLIYKETLPTDTLWGKTVSLPYATAEEASRAVMKTALQYGTPCMWYQADGTAEKREYFIKAIGTGHDWEDTLSMEQYIGTVLLDEDTLVLHYFIMDIEKWRNEK